VLVSHDLEAVEATCGRGVWLDRGVVAADGPIRDVLGAYRRQVESEAAAVSASGPVRLVSTVVNSVDGRSPRSGDLAVVVTTVECDEAVSGVVHLGVSEGTAAPVFTVQASLNLTPGRHEIRCELPHLPLPAGTFFAWTGAFDERKRDLLPWQPAVAFDVEGPRLLPAPTAVVRRAPLLIESRWTVDQAVIAADER